MLFFNPSNNRDWQDSVKVLPSADFSGDSVTINNIRDFEYQTEDQYKQKYYDQTFNLSKLKKSYLMVVPFNSFSFVAHMMLAFEFEDDKSVCFSIEVRKTIGQKFSPWTTLFPKYELVYVVGSENDLIKLRTNYRKGEHVYFYPLELTEEQNVIIFKDLLLRANKLKDKPEYFHLLFNSCGSNLISHINKALDKKFPWYLKYYAPGKADTFLHRSVLVKQDHAWSFEEFREKHYLNEKAKSFPENGNYSKLIREK